MLLTFYYSTKVKSVVCTICRHSSTRCIILFIYNNTIKFSSAGAYTIVADCLYPTIDENDTLNILDTLPESLVTIAVMYVAGQLMKDIDLTEALTTLNEYEYALARLDVDRQELNESFTISGGF